MHRTQIQITEEQMKMLREISREKHVSMSQIVREALDEYLRKVSSSSAEERRKRALSAVGKFRSGARDVSIKHDKYLPF